MARHPEVRKKLAASLPRLPLDAPLIDGKTVREDPQYEYLNACIKGMCTMHSFFPLLKTRLINLTKQKTFVSTPSPRSSDAAPCKNPQTFPVSKSHLTRSSQPPTERCTSKPLSALHRSYGNPRLTIYKTATPSTGLNPSVSGPKDSWPKTLHSTTKVRPDSSKSHSHLPHVLL